MTAPPPLSAAALLELVRQFSPRRRERADKLVRGGKVTVTHRSPYEVRGVVMDAKPFHAEVLLAGGTMKSTCNCPERRRCEHAIALLYSEAVARIHEEKQARAEPAASKQLERAAKRRSTAKAAKAAKSAAATGGEDTVPVAVPSPAPASAPRPVAITPPQPSPPPSAASSPQRNEMPPVPWQQRMQRLLQRFEDKLQERGPSERRAPPVFCIDVASSQQRGALVFTILVATKRRDEWSLRPATPSCRLEEFDPESARLLRRIYALEGIVSRFSTMPKSHQELREPWASDLLPAMAAVGRVVCVAGAGAEWPAFDAEGLKLDDGEPWQVAARLDQGPGRVALHGTLRRGDEVREAAAIRVLLDGYAVFDDRIVTVQASAAGREMCRELQRSPLAATGAEAEPLLSAVSQIASVLPELQLGLAVEDADPPELKVAIDTKRPFAGRFVLVFVFAYDDVVVNADAPATLPPVGPGQPARRRRLDFEQDLVEKLVHTIRRLAEPTQMVDHFLVPPTKLGDVVRVIREAGFEVRVDGASLRVASGSLAKVKTAVDWFEVEGGVLFDDVEVPIAEALAALARGESTVLLPNGQFGLLPDEALAPWRQLVEFAERQQGTLRVRRSQAALLDALLAARGDTAFAADQGFTRLRDRLRDFRGVGARAAPAGFQGTLRPYQQQGLGWLWFLRELGLGGCLADDMGLGKTVQVLALLQEVHADRQRPPSLLVVPRSLLDNWRREAERFTPSLRVFDGHGPDRWTRLAAAGGFAAFDLVVTTYGTARLDAARLVEQDVRFEYVVLDEAQAIENAQSLTSKAVRLLVGAHRLALTGTPVQNHLGELWALFEFLAPGLLGKSRTFQQLLRAGRDGKGIDGKLLQRALAPFLLRRTKAEVLPELPPKQEQTILCELDGRQQQAYAALRAHYQKVLLGKGGKLGPQERFVALEALLRLRQVACHEGLVDPARRADDAAKLDALLPMLRELVDGGHKALVFSQFTEFLGLVRERLDASKLRYEYLDGSTTKRQEAVDRFQAPDGPPLFLISLKAGGFGLNLTAADYVFLLDPWWNPAAEAQASDRAHRLGQVRKVTVYRLIAKDTVEEKVVQLQEKKRALVDAVMGQDESLLAGMTREDLAALLAP
jgi:superfamily II DNA or RNA helicase